MKAAREEIQAASYPYHQAQYTHTHPQVYISLYRKPGGKKMASGSSLEDNTMMEATNTIMVTNVDRDSFQESQISYYQYIIQNGISIIHWAPLKSFSRILAVFTDSEDALKAKNLLEEKNNTRIRIFFSTHTPLYSQEDSQQYLQLPDRGKLWLISPPPSPPIGWTSRYEDEPNKDTEHGVFSQNELDAALAKATESSYDEGSLQHHKTAVKRYTLQESSSSTSNSPKLTIDPDSATNSKSNDNNIDTPTIMLEWEDDNEDTDSHIPANDDSYPDRLRNIRTEIPPL